MISLPSLVIGEKPDSFLKVFSKFLADRSSGSVALYIDLPQKRILGTFVILHLESMALQVWTMIVRSLGRRFRFPVKRIIV